MRHTFSMGDRSGLQEDLGRSRTRTLYYEATPLEHVQNVAWHCLAEISRASLKKSLLGQQQMLLQNLDVPFSINGAFTDVPVTHDALGTNTPPYYQSCWLLNFALITIQMVLFLFGPEDTTSMISRNNLKCGLVRPQFPTLLRSTSDELRSRKSGAVPGCC
ncbi:hypothetical protein XENOCAPTIV_018377 [Xenoophorus captivus]|uniref:Uncharacterized protein n=1 Tax=Xenoophorus captivus TaxID=1517983 RepID=A0ABV0QBA7_9TELE